MSSTRLQDTKSIYKNQLCFYVAAMSKPKMKLRKTIPFIIASKRINYLGITKVEQNLLIKLQNTLKEIKDPNRWKDIPCSWVGRLNNVKMEILPKLIYRI